MFAFVGKSDAFYVETERKAAKLAAENVVTLTSQYSSSRYHVLAISHIKILNAPQIKRYPVILYVILC